MLLLGGVTQLPHIFPRVNLDSPTAYDDRLRVARDRDAFRRELLPIVASYGSTEDKVLAVLKWLMNQVKHVENVRSGGSWEMVEMARSGRGFGCGSMAQIFHDALTAIDIPARRVLLQREVFDTYDSHVTVEAFVDAKWRIYDPTFHIVVVSNGRRVGAIEAQALIRSGGFDAVRPEFLGEVQYPARFDQYPVRYKLLLDNVFVEMDRGSRLGRVLPVAGMFYGPQWAYVPSDGRYSTAPQEFYQRLLFITLVFFPLIGSLFMGLAVVFRRKALC